MPNYESNGVLFKNVVAGLNTGGQKINKAPYKYEEGNIKNPQTIINAIDIDWNSAEVPGIEEEITSTAQLLAKIGEMNQTIEDLNDSLESVEENIGGTGEGSIAERIDNINGAIEELQQSIGGTGEGSIAERIDNINGAIEELQQSIGGGGTGEGSIVSDIDDIKRQIQSILSGQTKITGHIDHVIMTEEEYSELAIKDENTIYFITDEEGTGSSEPDDEDPISTNLYVNGNLVTDTNVLLAPGRIYTLEGSVVGTITIDASNINNPEDLVNTELRLKNVKVISPNNYGIRYLTPQENTGYKDLVITLEKNTRNYIVCTEELAADENQPGAVYSMNNLTIQGPGYLACHNAGGHGIRATEVKLLDPHIYVEAVHDGIHGKKIWICGGSYYIEQANDAFGTGIGGTIRWAYGDIFVNKNIAGKLMYAKSGEEDGVQKDGKIIYVENNNMIIMGSPSPEESATLTTIPSAVYLNDPLHNPYNAGTVKEYDNAEAAKTLSGGTLVSDLTGIYIASKPFISVEGLITKPINIPSTISDATIYLKDAAIITNQITGANDTLLNEPSISYDAQTSNVKILAIKDTYNVIINNCPQAIDSQDCDAIKSEHNIKIEIKNDAYIYVSSVAGDGIDGTDVNITDSKGILMIHDCGERAIKGNNIIIGPSANTPQGAITLITDSTDQSYTTFDGAVIAYGNSKTYGSQPIRLVGGKIAVGSGYADIFARKGKAVDKGSFIITANELNGIIACGTVGATISINMDNSANMYYNELITLDNVTLANVPAATVETYIAYPYKKNPILRNND